RSGEGLARFIEPYGRPSLELFQAHTQLLVERYHLDTLRLKGRASGLSRTTEGWQVESDIGDIEARRIVIAIGSSEQPYWPDWAQSLHAAGASVHHIFDPNFYREDLPADSRILVVGGGITAAQT